MQGTLAMETFQLLLDTPECTRSPLTSLSPTSRHRVAALCSAQLPARASRHSPVLGAVAGSCIASQPCARPTAGSPIASQPGTRRRRRPMRLGFSAAAGSHLASQPSARRGCWLMRRVVALCSARPLAHASRRSLKDRRRYRLKRPSLYSAWLLLMLASQPCARRGCCLLHRGASCARHKHGGGNVVVYSAGLPTQARAAALC